MMDYHTSPYREDVQDDDTGLNESSSDKSASIADHPFLEIVESIVAILADNLDHPEVWRAVAESAEHDVTDLRWLLNQLQATQSGDVLKSINLVSAILHALTADRSEGQALLNRMVSDYSHCPQVAGAVFFVSRHGQPGPSADLTGRFCTAPFVNFETIMDGTVAPCCSIWTQQRLGHLDGQTADEIWNSPAAQEMRGSILDGSFRYCHKMRCSFIANDTLPQSASIADAEMRAIIDEGRVSLNTGPRSVGLAHDVTCNLSCPSCRDRILAANEAQERRFALIERDVLLPLMQREGQVTLSLSGQGDPWSSPHYRSILRHLADQDLSIALEINTNALLMNEQRWAEYSGLDKYRALVNVSIDACTPWVFETLRRPGKWEKLLPNLQFIAAKRARSEFREFHINATIQLDNYHEMGAMVALGQTLGTDTTRLYMIQNTGGHVAPDYARKNIADERHALHLAFLETLRDPRLGLPEAHLYDVGNWRVHALAATLPSDCLPVAYSRSDLADALQDSACDPERTVALCAAGRIRFPTDLTLPLQEARALATLGFRQQAEYRMKERLALGGEALALDGPRGDARAAA